jgi:hypothetical protein
MADVEMHDAPTAGAGKKQNTAPENGEEAKKKFEVKKVCPCPSAIRPRPSCLC